MAERATHGSIVWIDYTNYRGERSWRSIYPHLIRFGSNAWHNQEQWLLDATDPEKKEVRTFAMRDIHAWRSEPPESYKVRLAR